MPVIRNPFRKHAPPPLAPRTASTPSPMFEQLGEGGADDTSIKSIKSTSAVSIVKTDGDDEKNTYKMSVVNGGVYLPPSPTEKKNFSFLKRDNSSTSIKNRPPLSPSDEPFTISRESFDSYRRSFDISARSPISDAAPGRNSLDLRPATGVTGRASMDVRPSRMSLDVPARMSLDSRSPPSRMSLDQRSPRMPPTVKDVEEPTDEFEDVRLDDGPRPKKLGLFSRFGGEHSSKDAAPKERPLSGLFSRRDHTAGTEQESELKYMSTK